MQRVFSILFSRNNKILGNIIKTKRVNNVRRKSAMGVNFLLFFLLRLCDIVNTVFLQFLICLITF